MKKLIALMLSFILVLSLAGCGETSNKTEKEPAVSSLFENINESEENRSLSNIVVKYLKLAGHTVDYYEINEANDYLQKQVAKANSKDYDLVVQIHFNAYKNTTDEMGTEVLYLSDSGKVWAEKINAKLSTVFKNRGVKCQDFTVIYKTVTPCVLVEYGFYSNKDDLKILKNNQNELVEATLKGICKYFNIKYQEPKKETVKTDSTASNTYYRVVAGSYTNRSNADKLVSELKSKGYSAFIDIYKK